MQSRRVNDVVEIQGADMAAHRLAQIQAASVLGALTCINYGTSEKPDYVLCIYDEGSGATTAELVPLAHLILGITPYGVNPS